MATCHLISKCWMLTWISVLMLSSSIISGEEPQPTSKEPGPETEEPTGKPIMSSHKSIQPSSIINSQKSSFGGSKTSNSFMIQTSSQTVSSNKPIVPSTSHSWSSTEIVSTVKSRTLFSSSSMSPSRHVAFSKTSNFYSSSEVSYSQSIKESSVKVIMTSTVSPMRTHSTTISYRASEISATSSTYSSTADTSTSISHSKSLLSTSSFNVVHPTKSSSTTMITSSLHAAPSTSLSKSSLYTVDMLSSVISNSTSSIGTVITSSPLSIIAPTTTLKNSPSSDMILSSLSSGIIASVAMTKSMNISTYMATRSISSGVYAPSTSIKTIVSSIMSDIIPYTTKQSDTATSSSVSSEVNASTSSPGLSSQIVVTPSPSMLQTSTLPSSTPSTRTPYLTTARSSSLTSISFDVSYVVTPIVSSSPVSSSSVLPVYTSTTKQSDTATSSYSSVSSEVNVSTSSPGLSSQIVVTPSPSMLQTSTLPSSATSTHTPYLTTARSVSLTSGSSAVSYVSFVTSVITPTVLSSPVLSVTSAFKTTPTSSFLPMSTSVLPTMLPPKAPSSPPLDVAVYNTSTTFVIVSWKTPPEETLNGKLNHYEVDVQKIDSSACQENVTNTSFSTPPSSSANSVSSSYDSQVSLEPTSSVKTVLALSSSVKPTEPTGPPKPPLSLTGLINAGLNLSKTINNLEVFTCYGIKVRAFTSLPGPWSPLVLTRTMKSEPTFPPQNVTASTMSSTSILVQWLPPLHIYGVIKHYIVEYFSATQRNNITTADNSTSLNLTSLLPYTTYYVRVRAVNAAGPGPPSENVTSTTLEDAPSPPTNFTIQSVNATSLYTRWSPPNRLNGDSVKYKLYYRLTAHNNSKDAAAYDGENTEFVLTGLQKLSNYTIRLFAYNYEFHSQEFRAFAFTLPTVATEPLGLQAWNISSTSVFVTWQPPKHINGILTNYKVFYKPNDSSSIPGEVLTNLSTNITLHSMRVYTLYIIYVCAVIDQECGLRATVFVMTGEGVPSEVRSFSQYDKTSTTVGLKWNSPEYPNGLIGYELLYGKLADFKLLKTLETNVTISKLLPYTNYTFIIKAYNLRSSQSGPSRNITIQTRASEPSLPRNVQLVSPTNVSLTIAWDYPDPLNGHLLYCTIMVAEVGNSQFIDPVKAYVNPCIVKSLKPFKEYSVYVFCTTNGGSGPKSETKTFGTLPSAPPPVTPIKPPNKDTITQDQIVIELEKASDSNGKISYYQVVVLELSSNSDGKAIRPDRNPDDYTPNELYTYIQAKLLKPKRVPYIAAQFPAEEFSKYQLFKIGDGRNFSIRARKRRDTTDQYYNGPLQPSTFYTMFQRAAVNKDVYRSTGWTQPVTTSDAATKQKRKERSSDTNIGLVAGLCVTLVFLIVVAIVVFRLVWKKRRFPFGMMLDDEGDYSNRSFKLKKISRRRTSSRGLMGSTDSLDNLDDINRRREPIPVDAFSSHVRQMHIDGDIGFSEEYELVQPDDTDFTWQHSLMPVNKHKNRYANIVAYDHSRVLLAPIEGVQGSDYINANYIDGYNRSGAYIATQGPLPETFDDFWRMIWEQGTATIVMLTQLEERGRRKCDQYWPDRGTHTYGMIRVTASESSHMSYYNLRVFLISHKDDEEEPRQVKQYHFTSWPDHGVPTHPVPLLSLVRTVAHANPSTAGPAIVHCSAGVGRTGTYITLDSVLQRIEKEQTIDVYEFVQNMRLKRNLMVQTESQYVFIHDALVEAVSCGITECEAKKFASRLRDLRETDPNSGRTYMEKEFLRLVKDERHHSTFKAANMGVNSSKNRYLNILPYEQTRVPLKMRPGEVGSDYINASYIDGYCRRKVYIATQAPLPCTFEDYWRMVWEQGSCAIVMLTKEEEAGKVKCHRYWPSDGTRIFGDVLVELTEEVSYTDYTMRQFNMTHTEEKDCRVVRQYHYTDWPDIGLPESGVGIIDLIGQVEKWQQQSNNSIITVHCSGGVGRTGVYCAISILIERVKSEGVIDVFQSVQSLRLQRPAMVQTLEQYEFCYSTLQEYLDSFDLYANFN